MTTDQKIIIGVILLTLVIITGGVYWFSSRLAVDKERLNRSLIGEKIPTQGGGHVKEGELHSVYNSNPPTSGPHWAGVAGPGIKTEPVADELVLHSMEHGAVVLWYKADLPESEVSRLKDVFKSASGKKIMLPRENLDVPVALTSWGYLLKMDTVDEVAIREFIETNNDRAPEKAPI